MKKLMTASMAASVLLLATQTNAADLQLQAYKPDQNAIFPVVSVLASGEKDAILFDAQFSVKDGEALVDMIKKRFGDDFANSITANLEVKTQEAVKRDAKGKGRKPRGEYKGDRKPRENKG